MKEDLDKCCGAYSSDAECCPFADGVRKGAWELFQEQKDEPWGYEDYDDFLKYEFITTNGE